MENNVERCRFGATRKTGFFLMWEITRLCNLECLHCCTDSSPEASTLNDVPTDRMINIIREFDEVGIRDVFFSGGEPFLRKDFLELIDHIDSSNTNVYIASNGTFVNQEKAKFLKSKVAGIDISLDGHTKELHKAVRLTDISFERALEGISACVVEEVPMRVSSMITPQNVDFVDDFLELMISLGVQRVVFQTIVDAAGRARKNPHLVLNTDRIPEILRTINAKQGEYKGEMIIEHRFADQQSTSPGCPAGQNILHITPDGDISPCSWLFKIDPTRFKLGNIKTDSLAGSLANLDPMLRPLLDKTDWCLIPLAKQEAPLIQIIVP